MTCTIDNGGSVIDPHGYLVGMVDLAISSCEGSGPTAGCVGNTCGDGIKAGTEACDDGDDAPNDGCSAQCGVEAGYACATPVVTTQCVACGEAGQPCCPGGACANVGLTCEVTGLCE
ncbi:MAG: hypothetical protein R3F39_15175 [Myxococcota bacterium]